MVLVDGGLKNNYPADIAREMGADIIIGVTVQGPPKVAEDMGGTMSIISQIVDVNCKNKYDENLAITDLHMPVDTKGFNAASFTQSAIDTLIRRGEEEAMRHWDEIIALKKRIGIDENFHPIILSMHYRQIIILLVSCFVALGIYGLSNINKNEFPDFTIRQGIVVAVYPGVTAQEMEEQVTKPLEKYIFQYREVKKEKTVSYSKDGMCIIQVELNDDLTNKDEFWSKFKHGVQGFQSKLPSGVLAIVHSFDFKDLVDTVGNGHRHFHLLFHFW